ncbi:molybdopterin synthase catalytic subunit MoaE [uncultured Shewanella sp.]|uniref:molybdopterin synthase catalytic subunit MoaE n=1 Tax=uncultured Shewanella sp. TaxID=173975 RepID=UPI0026208BCF|nr:molybdopterin synthase catalytic subunit MoaE [uncultured Shewanella sp.]
MIRVQTEDFSLADEYQDLNTDDHDGAIVTFVGKVRDFNDAREVTKLTLEHYPGMTETVLAQIEEQARERWPLNKVTIIHRVGTLALGEQIVFIGVTSQHRKAAFEACEFLIDFLKIKAPFWKLEANEISQHWIDAKTSDDLAAKQWQSE